MVQPSKRKGHAGALGTPTIVERRPKPKRTPPANNKPCPVCKSRPGEACREVVSPPTAARLRRGEVRWTLHPERGTPTSGAGSPAAKRTGKPKPKKPPEPVPITRIKPDVPVFVPANRRGNVTVDEHGRTRTAGWTRNNPDALPRPTTPT